MKNFWLIARVKVDNDVIGLESSLTDRSRSSACYVCVFYRYTYFKIKIYIYIYQYSLFKYVFYRRSCQLCANNVVDNERS